MRPSEDIERLIRAEHWDPFCVLGPRTVTANGKRATLVRAFLPEAVEAYLLPGDQGTRPVAMTSAHVAGLFEATVPPMGEKPRYRLRVPDRRGGVTECHDPYAYPPLLSDFDLHLFAEGRLHRAYEILGAHLHTVDDVAGVRFAVWAPNALRVSVVGDFNGWDGRRHPMRSRGATGLWELFIPDIPEGSNYKYEIRPRDHDVPFLKADPYAFAAELRPKTASIVRDISRHRWGDQHWMAARANRDPLSGPLSIYEVHLGSWMRVPEEGSRWLTYRELTERLIPYAKDMGYTHLELMPVTEHPFDGSWGYQTTGDYARKPGEWIPNRFGGNENLEAIEFLTEFNIVIHREYPGVLTIAEESTAWPGVSRPTYAGGLGFSLKWNLGWMHDMLDYFGHEPVHPKDHPHHITFGLLYAVTANFVLVLSHDEVVHRKKALLDKMPGDTWQRFANLRALYGYLYGHPGKKMLFMGGEFGQWSEWSHDDSLPWHLCQHEPHLGLQRYVRDLNRLHRNEPSLHQADFDWTGFQWIDYNDGEQSAIAFMRKARDQANFVVCVCNFTPVPRHGYRIGVPAPGWYRELLNSDAAFYGGSNVGNWGGVQAEATPWHGLPYSLSLTLPPLAVLFLKPS